MHRLIGDDLWNLLNTTYGGRLAQRALADFSPSTPAELQVFSRHEVGPATFLRQAAERLKNTHALDDVHSALCQFFRCVCWHGIFSRGGVTWSMFFGRSSAGNSQLVEAAEISRVRCTHPSDRAARAAFKRPFLCGSCLFLLPTTPIS